MPHMKIFHSPADDGETTSTTLEAMHEDLVRQGRPWTGDPREFSDDEPIAEIFCMVITWEDNSIMIMMPDGSSYGMEPGDGRSPEQV